MSDSESDRQQQILDELAAIRSRLRRLGIVVSILALLIALTVATVYGQLVNYFNADVMFYGATGLGAALGGFLAGWMAGRRR